MATEVSIVQGATEVSVVGAIPLVDDQSLTFGTGGTVKLLYETADPNANHLNVVFPEGGATDVPVIVFGDASIDNVDLGFFNGITEPTLAVLNDAADAYASLDAGDDAVAGSKGLYFKAAADEDIELVNLSVTGTPRIYWDESEDQFRSTKGWVFDAACDVQGTWVATAAWTLPAFTLGGTVTLAGQVFSNGAAHVEFDNTGAGYGLIVQSTQDAGTGAIMMLRHISASPAAEDIIGQIRGDGRDSVGNDELYVNIRFVIADPTSTSEDGRLDIYALNAGASNLALQLTGAGVLSVDDTGISGTYANVDLFDEYDDVAEIQRIVQRFDKERAVELGLHIRKPDGEGYMMSFQPWIKLLAGAHYQTRETINEMRQLLLGFTERLKAVEGTTKLLQTGG